MILSGRREDALERVKRACEEASTASTIEREGLRVEVLPFDVADLEFVEKEAVGRAIQLFGRVDALVLNAGVRRGQIDYSSHALFFRSFVRTPSSGGPRIDNVRDCLARACVAIRCC